MTEEDAGEAAAHATWRLSLVDASTPTSDAFGETLARWEVIDTSAVHPRGFRCS